MTKDKVLTPLPTRLLKLFILFEKLNNWYQLYIFSKFYEYEYLTKDKSCKICRQNLLKQKIVTLRKTNAFFDFF